MVYYTRDLLISFIVGIIAGSLAFISLLLIRTIAYPLLLSLLVPLSFSILAVAGFALALWLSTWFPGIIQIAKFLAVGGLSTFIELSILNVLFFVTGMTSGIFYSLFKAFTFLIALINSYFLNRNWTFQANSNNMPAEFGKFFVSNIIGLLLNVGTASFIVNVVVAPDFVSSVMWANIGTIVAVFVTMVWNFLSYKYFVFSKSAE